MSDKTNLPFVDLGKNLINCLKLNENNNIVKFRKVDITCKSCLPNSPINNFTAFANPKCKCTEEVFFLNGINDSNKYGLKTGTYNFINNNEEYPMGFVVKSDYVDVTGQNYKGSEYVNGINVSFYTGTITINVKNNFQFMSVYFLNKGYLGGEKRFVFTQLCSAMKCGCDTFQSYNTPTFGKDIKLCNLLPLWNRILCQNNQNAKLRKIIRQQDLYALMRRRPELFPITTYVQQMNLSLADQRRYSNLWYRQFGTSQALPVNDVWGGFYVVGSEVPYTN
jgi:hypothetical protein